MRAHCRYQHYPTHACAGAFDCGGNAETVVAQSWPNHDRTVAFIRAIMMSNIMRIDWPTDATLVVYCTNPQIKTQLAINGATLVLNFALSLASASSNDKQLDASACQGGRIIRWYGRQQQHCG